MGKLSTDSATAILNRFPFKYGIYRLFEKPHVDEGARYGWLVISEQEDGHVLMWRNRRIR